jgi:hypothetical protein
MCRLSPPWIFPPRPPLDLQNRALGPQDRALDAQNTALCAKSRILGVQNKALAAQNKALGPQNGALGTQSRGLGCVFSHLERSQMMLGGFEPSSARVFSDLCTGAMFATCDAGSKRSKSGPKSRAGRAKPSYRSIQMQMQMQAGRQAGRQAGGQVGRQEGGQAAKQPSSQAAKQPGRQAGKQMWSLRESTFVLYTSCVICSMLHYAHISYDKTPRCII